MTALLPYEDATPTCPTTRVTTLARGPRESVRGSSRRTARVTVIPLGLALLAVFAPSSRAADTAGLQQQTLYTSGQEGYHTYRIPAVVQTNSGTLLAFCEGRVRGGGDSGDIDLVLRRSDDGGAHWGPMQVVWDDAQNVCGNPCPVVDRTTGTIWLLMTHNLGIDHESEIIQGTSEGTRTIWVARSDDDGATWSTPRELTSTVKAPDWTWYATGPGAGIQLQRGPHPGRLVVPCDHIERDSKRYYSHVIFSDDHGQSWQLGGSSPRDQTNECEVVELSDGRLMLNMRNYDRTQRTRQVALSDDGGATWRDQHFDEALIEPICQASIRRVTWPTDDEPGLILFSNPASREAREKMTIRGSWDDGATWPLARQLYEGGSAYSCLVALVDGSAACLYEADNYRRIVFAKFTRAWLQP